MGRKSKPRSDAKKANLLNDFLRELAGDVISEFDGPRGLAQKMKDCYERSAPGSVTRQRVLEMAVKAVTTGGDIQDDEDNMSLEELEAEAQELEDGTGNSD